jgi:hypothetical protein
MRATETPIQWVKETRSRELVRFNAGRDPRCGGLTICVLHRGEAVAAKLLRLLKPDRSDGVHGYVKAKTDQGEQAEEYCHWGHSGIFSC